MHLATLQGLPDEVEEADLHMLLAGERTCSRGGPLPVPCRDDCQALYVCLSDAAWLLAAYPGVQSVRITRERSTGRCKGYAFVVGGPPGVCQTCHRAFTPPAWPALQHRARGVRVRGYDQVVKPSCVAHRTLTAWSWPWR